MLTDQSTKLSQVLQRTSRSHCPHLIKYRIGLPTVVLQTSRREIQPRTTTHGSDDPGNAILAIGATVSDIQPNALRAIIGLGHISTCLLRPYLSSIRNSGVARTASCVIPYPRSNSVGHLGVFRSKLPRLLHIPWYEPVLVVQMLASDDGTCKM